MDLGNVGCSGNGGNNTYRGNTQFKTNLDYSSNGGYSGYTGNTGFKTDLGDTCSNGNRTNTGFRKDFHHCGNTKT